MVSSGKPTIAIIPGGWHQPASYSKLTTGLEQAGFEVHAVNLPAMNGHRPPDADLKEDTEAARNLIGALCNEGKHVIVLMHSYGGQVGTNALSGLGLEARSKQNLPGGVARLIYMTAFAMPEGKAMMDKVAEFGHLELIPQAFDFADDKSVVSRFPKELVIGPGISDAEMDEYIATFARWNGNSMYQNLDVCAWREIPVTYFHTKDDMTVPYDYQTSMVEYMRKEGVKVDTVEFVSGHCPNLTITGEVVAAIEQVAAKC